MKIKYLLITIATMVLSLSLYSQRFNGGVTAGIAMTQVAGDTYGGYNKPGIYAGGFVNLQVSPHSVFQMELVFFQKGSRQNPNIQKGITDEYLFRANYVEMPLFYQYVVNKRIKIEAGPSAGFLINRVERDDGDDITYRMNYNEPAKVTLQINAGIYVAITQRFMVNFRTNNSLLNIRSDVSNNYVWRFWGYGQFHDSLVLSLVYLFRNQSEEEKGR